MIARSSMDIQSVPTTLNFSENSASMYADGRAKKFKRQIRKVEIISRTISFILINIYHRVR
jgi:hypothetical protein